MNVISVRVFVFIFFALLNQIAFAATNERTIDLITNYMAEWNKHAPEEASKYLSDNMEFLDASIGIPQKGRKAATDNVIKVFLTAVPDLKWKMLGEPVVQGNNISFEWEFDGTNTGSWSEGVPATNKRLTFKGVSFIRTEGGKIISQHDYYDALSFNKQLGW